MSAISLPFVCAWCERERTSAGHWVRSDTGPITHDATHGICPDCLLAETREAQVSLPETSIPTNARPLV